MLESVKKPSDIRHLDIRQLNALAQEIRDVIVERVSLNGGHLASNLGVIELTIALHYAFESPMDRIIWDVGHQSYAHKLLTGRYGEFYTLRKYGGISGFPRMNESEHDAFGTGHSSTSISASLGILAALRHKEKGHKVVAVIGDGAMTAGLAFEGLNHAGHLKKDLIVVLNDNDMSISSNVGALSAYLNKMMTGDLYTRFRKETKSILGGIPKFGESMVKMAKKAEGSIKGFLTPGALFEELGFKYIGPIDGHRIDFLIDVFRRMKAYDRPVLIHVVTKKGKGYSPAEKNPCLFHGIGPFDIETGIPKGISNVPTFSEVFGKTLTGLAMEDKRIIAITAAMTDGTGLETFARTFPDRFYDVGIAEQHAVTFAAGLASHGMRPVVAIYSTFLQRAYDELIHDVCLQNLSVVFAIDRAGIVGDDGPTHNGTFDLSYLRHIPNMVVMSPKDENELRHMLRTAIEHNGPSAIRYPRGRVLGITMDEEIKTIPIGLSEVMEEGDDLLIVAIGNMLYPALKASEILKSNGISATVLNARFVKPIDKELIGSLAKKIRLIITVEENSLQGGFGSAIIEYLSELDIDGLRIKRIGLPDSFIEQGPQSILRKRYGLDPDGIVSAALSLLRLKGIPR